MSLQREQSLILLSGGLDSAANLALCHQMDQPVLAITVRYGQRAEESEVLAAKDLCAYYGVPHQVVDLKWLGQLGGSALTQSSVALPILEAEHLNDSKITGQSVKAVWVPNRNGVLIQVAAAFAESLKVGRVVVGFNIEEAATFPDNSPEFIRRSNLSLEYSTFNQVKVHCYTAELTKSQIVTELKKLAKPFPFEKIWSCYQGGALPCGECESCRRLQRALA